MSRFIKRGEAAKILGITVQTLRRWESKGELIAYRKSEGGTRYYDIDRLLGLQDIETDLTIGYARVSSRLYGARSHKNKKLVEAAKVLVE